MSTQELQEKKPADELFARLAFLLGRLRRSISRTASMVGSLDGMLLSPQFRRYKPLDSLPWNGPGRPTKPRRPLLVVLLLIMLMLGCVHYLGLEPTLTGKEPVDAAPRRHTLPRNWSATGNEKFDGAVDFMKPDGLKVVGLVFYGRPASVSILDCYLKVCETPLSQTVVAGN